MEKLQPNLRIDVFDAAVFAACAYLEDLESVQKAKNWFGRRGSGTMSKRKKEARAPRDRPAQKRSSVAYVLPGNWDGICCDGYTRLADNPEVRMAVGRKGRGSDQLHVYPLDGKYRHWRCAYPQ